MTRRHVLWYLAVALAVIPRESAGQADSLSRIFRRALVEIAAAGAMPRLDSTKLAPGVRREIRVYTGFGFGGYSMLRLWDDGAGVHGRLGTFWTIGDYLISYSSPAEKRAGHAQGRAYDARMRAFVDSAYGCRTPKRSNFIGVCWLQNPPRPDSWTRLRAVLDSLRVNDIPYPVRPRMGLDGWAVLVEVRTPVRYRSYLYWEPDSLSADPWERAARRIGTAVATELRAVAPSNRSAPAEGATALLGVLRPSSPKLNLRSRRTPIVSTPTNTRRPMSIPTHSEQSSDSPDIRTPPPAVIDTDENLFTVLRNQARSRSRSGLWMTTIGGAVNAGLVLWQYPSLSWLGAGFVAAAAYGGWGLVDRAIAAKNAESRDTPVTPDALPEMRGLIGLAGTAAAIWAILGFMATALGNWHF